MRTFSELIDELGGYLAVSEELGVPKGTASAMKTRNSIPPKHWAAITKLAQRLGKPTVTIEMLAGLSARKGDKQGEQVLVAEKADAA